MVKVMSAVQVGDWVWNGTELFGAIDRIEAVDQRLRFWCLLAALEVEKTEERNVRVAANPHCDCDPELFKCGVGPMIGQFDHAMGCPYGPELYEVSPGHWGYKL